MNKFYGKIGFAETTETSPGIWTGIIEREYYGQIEKSSRQLSGTDVINDNVVLAHSLSILADPYAVNHYQNIRFIEFNDVKWKVASVEVQFPRLKLTTGGLYNG